jgi:hypothetical protein
MRQLTPINSIIFPVYTGICKRAITCFFEVCNVAYQEKSLAWYRKGTGYNPHFVDTGEQEICSKLGEKKRIPSQRLNGTDVTTLKIWAGKSTFSYTGSVEQ